MLICQKEAHTFTTNNLLSEQYLGLVVNEMNISLLKKFFKPLIKNVKFL